MRNFFTHPGRDKEEEIRVIRKKFIMNRDINHSLIEIQ